MYQQALKWKPRLKQMWLGPPTLSVISGDSLFSPITKFIPVPTSLPYLSLFFTRTDRPSNQSRIIVRGARDLQKKIELFRSLFILVWATTMPQHSNKHLEPQVHQCHCTITRIRHYNSQSKKHHPMSVSCLQYLGIIDNELPVTKILHHLINQTFPPELGGILIKNEI